MLECLHRSWKCLLPAVPCPCSPDLRMPILTTTSFFFLVRINSPLQDLGLAKVIKRSDPGVDEFYRMSGEVGSLRYMSPEVARQHP